MGRRSLNFDWINAVLLLCISLFGVFLLLSIDKSLAYSQLISIGISIIVLILVVIIDRYAYIYGAPFAYILFLAGLIATLLFPPIRGARRWIEFAGFQIQPSELGKPLFLLSFSWIFAKFPARKIRYLILHILLILFPIILIFRQPDLGTMIVYITTWLAMIFAAGLPIGALIGTLASFVLGFPFILKLLESYQKERLLTFINPNIDPRGSGYNVLQAMIAVGSGQIFGRGLGRGTQSHLLFLPEYQTDFIFAALVEEFGLIGGFCLLIVYGIVLWRIIQPLLRGSIRNAFLYTYSVGLFFMILTQVVINAGMNMGIIPVTGITLPLVSYGGSSMLSIAISFGILWSITRSNHNKPDIAI